MGGFRQPFEEIRWLENHVTIDAHAVLESIEAGNEPGNEKRKQPGWSPLAIDVFVLAWWRRAQFTRGGCAACGLSVNGGLSLRPQSGWR